MMVGIGLSKVKCDKSGMSFKYNNRILARSLCNIPHIANISKYQSSLGNKIKEGKQNKKLKKEGNVKELFKYKTVHE